MDIKRFWINIYEEKKELFIQNMLGEQKHYFKGRFTSKIYDITRHALSLLLTAPPFWLFCCCSVGKNVQ